MGELTAELREFLDAQRVGVLATVAADGRPRQSLVYYARDGVDLVLSTLAQRLKAKDVERSGWASLCVMGHEAPYPSAVFSGHARIETDGIGVATAAVMQRITGALEPPEPQSDEALESIGRVVMRITVERISAVNYIEPSQPNEAAR
jgi:PPOX class probable F420-dependent enzyme